VFDLLVRFLEARPGEILQKRDLLEHVWPDVVVDEGSLTKAVSTLRRTLQDTDPPTYIVTEPARGYRFIAVVANSLAAPQPAVDDAPSEAGASPVPVPAAGSVEVEARASGAATRPGSRPVSPARRRRRSVTIATAAMAIAAVVFVVNFALGRREAGADPAPGPVRSFDFETGIENWAAHGSIAHVTTDCGSVVRARNGNCSLVVAPQPPSLQDSYVRVVDPIDAVLVEAWVNVPTVFCTASACSTAKVIIWDSGWASDEGLPVELRPGWKRICIDLTGRPAQQPLRAIGVHVIEAPDAPPVTAIYIDQVTIAPAGAFRCAM
jgi:DNA-binding winged helix-turn-helix (wHTH) protein